MQSKFLPALTISAALVLSACFEWNKDNAAEVDDDIPAANQLPTITGAPAANIREGEAYSFTPSASDPDGDTLEFTVSRKPSWASFDRATGHLSGTPQSADVGNFTNIGISVSDGQDSAALPDFDITVNQIALGTATLSWMPPTENADGSPLTDLAGYRIYYGRNSNLLDQTVNLDNPGLTRYVIDNLSPANWYFSMTSVNARGAESDRSATASKTIS